MTKDNPCSEAVREDIQPRVVARSARSQQPGQLQPFRLHPGENDTEMTKLAAS